MILKDKLYNYKKYKNMIEYNEIEVFYGKY